MTEATPNKSEIRALFDATAIDKSGDKLGSIKEVFVDDRTGQPTFVEVGHGLFGMSSSLVPLRGSSLSGDTLHLGFSKDAIKDAPDLDADNGLSVEEENRIYEHYQLTDARDVDYFHADTTNTSTDRNRSDLTGADRDVDTHTDRGAVSDDSGHVTTTDHDDYVIPADGTRDATGVDGGRRDPMEARNTGDPATPGVSAVPGDVGAPLDDHLRDRAGTDTRDDATTPRASKLPSDVSAPVDEELVRREEETVARNRTPDDERAAADTTVTAEGARDETFVDRLRGSRVDTTDDVDNYANTGMGAGAAGGAVRSDTDTTITEETDVNASRDVDEANAHGRHTKDDVVNEVVEGKAPGDFQTQQDRFRLRRYSDRQTGTVKD
ncbi:PRC-barrel domain protein [Corynebacterium efficiens YS-314]|nr:PRC-barrel domain-containing protein [Corynebacterium efficiens]EEW49230.1 PRC-barrel domain protein [Corynebacterium efficiens YS-314]